jgi:hypothetical protein
MPPSPEPYGTLKHPAALFGCDNVGVYMDEAPEFINERGILMRRLLIVPKGHLIKDNQILLRPGTNWIQTKEGPAVWVEYPAKYIHAPSDSPTNKIIRIDCQFNGSPSHYTRLHEIYTDKIEELEEKIERLKRSNVSLHEDMEYLQMNVAANMKRQSDINKLAGGGKSGGTDEETGEDSRDER